MLDRPNDEADPAEYCGPDTTRTGQRAWVWPDETYTTPRLEDRTLNAAWMNGDGTPETLPAGHFKLLVTA